MTSPRVLFVGRATLDVLYSLDEFPAQDTKVFARDMRSAPGGPALNAAITHALLGGKAILIAAIGGGPWSRSVCDELEALGIYRIDLAAGTRYELPVTTAFLNTANATRTIVNPPRSAVELQRPDFWDPVWGSPPLLALTDGFHLNETLPLLAACREAGTQLVLDGGSWKPGTDELTPLLAAAICSERFVAPGQPADPDSTIDWFVQRGVPRVAITRGAHPILGWDQGHRFEIEIEKIEAADTLGAGDVLHGAFCYHFALGESFEPALRNAAAIATRSCAAPGIRAWASKL